MIEDTWQEHLGSPFPKGCAGDVVDGVHLAALDADTSGYLTTFFGSRLKLSQSATFELRTCFNDLSKITPLLSGEAQVYFTRLRDLTEAVLESLGAFRRAT